MSVNSNPNLFRLSLPEWLKEQVDIGVHKGVYWVNEKDRIFHVPWKHASRNGWEDNDVSLFKAWAVYTNRYREGIDNAKPALWKTNFRCAINSHNSIVFLKDQGQRKGDSAHRIMQLLETPKKSRRILHSNQDTCDEPPRKLVRLTFPSFNPQTQPPLPSENNTQLKDIKHCSESCLTQTKDCTNCNEIKRQMQIVLEKLAKEDNTESSEFLICKAKFVEILSLNEHICLNESWLQFITEKVMSTSHTDSDNKEKPNLNDLYNVGKALQSAIDCSVDIKTLIAEEIVENISNDTSTTVFIAYQNINTEAGEEEVTIQESLNEEHDPLQCQPYVEHGNELNDECSEETKSDQLFYAVNHREDEDELIKPRH